MSVQAMKHKAYRIALLCGAFERGCAAKPQAGVGISRKKMLRDRPVLSGRFSFTEDFLWMDY